MLIRDETPADVAAIDEILAAAFETHPHSDQREPLIVRELRAAGALTLALVAEDDGEIAGHIAFSPVTIGRLDGWFALGPLAVAPARQGRGIGAFLVRTGLDRLRGLGAQGCTLVGEPGYYARFGFAREPGLICNGIPDAYVLALSFADLSPRGRVLHHPAFEAGL